MQSSYYEHVCQCQKACNIQFKKTVKSAYTFGDFSQIIIRAFDMLLNQSRINKIGQYNINIHWYAGMNGTEIWASENKKKCDILLQRTAYLLGCSCWSLETQPYIL